MDTQVLIIVISVLGPVVGFLVGTLMQAVFAQKMERQKRNAELIASAFSDFVEGIARAKFAVQSEDLSEQLEALSLQTEAKVKLCVYGSPSVVQALASLERTSMKMSDPNAANALISVCRTVRNEVYKKKHAVDDADIQVILFGTQSQ
ncbi:MAG: hypothetical protein PHI18_00570 [bacterium]|nr:hypothetical protein [bacterium]